LDRGVTSAWDRLDPRVRAALAEQGIQKLYPPQEQALGPVLDRRNVVVAIPTASGKSLIAYLAILHNRLHGDPPGKALYIVPLRALASEKFDELRQFQSLGLRVGIASGDLDEEDQHLARYDVIVATSEKMDSLLRHRVGWIHDIRVIVSDEVHLIHDAGRGPTLEVLLARFRALNPGAQIVALSATIKNSKQLADWLGASLVQSDWRPTPLKKGILFGRAITFEDKTKRVLTTESPDPVTDLVIDMLKEKGQCLVFVNARRSAEAVAKKLAKPVSKTLSAEEQAALKTLGADLTDEGEPSLAGAQLGHLMAHGVAYHTAGLSNRQRKTVEQNFRSGKIKVICATPTLAAGVNTPARRVIIRDVWRYDTNLGNQPIPVLEIQQMMGRAGRPRFDPYGEAVMLAKSEDERDVLVKSYLEAEPEPITSKLGTEPALRVHVLSSIAAGFTPTVALLERFLDSTFYAHQGESWLIKARLQEVLRFLVDNDFVDRHLDDLRPTLFGKRTSDLYIDPLSALTLRRALEVAQKREEVSTFAYLHALSSTVDLDPLYMRQKDDWVFEKAAEVEEQVLLGAHEAHSYEDFLSQVKTATLLEDWIEEKPLDHLEERFGVGPGDVRNKVDRAQWLAHAMRELARLVHYETAQDLNHLPLRLEVGAKKELLPLIEMEGIGRVRARILWNNNLRSPGAIRKARLDEISRLPSFGEILARKLKKQVGDETPVNEPTLEGF
jgi:helicase